MNQQKLIEKRRRQMLEGQYKNFKDAANYESVSSQLPGRLNGPADAYRHIIWIAETARRNRKRITPLQEVF